MNKLTMFLFGATWKKITAGVIGGLGVGVVASRYLIWRNPILVGQNALADLTPEQKTARMNSVKQQIAGRKAMKKQPAQTPPAAAPAQS